MKINTTYGDAENVITQPIWSKHHELDWKVLIATLTHIAARQQSNTIT